ncbi:hypothetical protein [Tabrizicola sp. TH137]|uniref:hypothetical protein n=1 Tax=Tabrizicola sp. TH137 TaxID=2067452 RepID=UPI0013041F2F|nr:hypothetical protein [Tabrizicola sp. TH137]
MPADSTLWERMGFNGASALGITGVDTRPYTRLSEGANGMAQKVLDDAAAIFPEFDGLTQLALPLPADYASPSLASFLNWHSAHQVQYLKDQAPNWTAGDLRLLTFGTSVDPTQNETFLLTADGKQVLRIATLQPTEIARLALADQERLAMLPAFRELHANPMGLWPADDIFNLAASGGTAPPATVDEARARIETEILAPFETLVLAAADPTRRNETITAENLAALYPNLFLDQIASLRRRLDRMAVFNPDVISQMVADLNTRFTRLQSYSTVTPPGTTDATSRLTTSVNSIDNLAGINRALQIFLQSELRQRDILATNDVIVFDGTFQNRAVDTPLMVFLFQTQENYSDEADAQARSEELNQTKSLLEAYAKMQQFVNDTIRSFDPTQFQKDNENNPDAVERKSFMNVANTASLNLSTQDLLVVSMFDRTFAPANGNSFLPIERETNSTRPTFPITNPAASSVLVAYTQQEWDLFSQDLSKISKVLSADSEARMDAINRVAKEKNRHYELATETVTKMTEILRSILN